MARIDLDNNSIVVNYRSAYHFSDNDRGSFYFGPSVGVRKFSEDGAPLLIPVGLRMGVRGGLARFTRISMGASSTTSEATEGPGIGPNKNSHPFQWRTASVWTSVGAGPAAARRATTVDRSVCRSFAAMDELKEFWRTYSPYFVDVWQYLVIIVIFIIAALVIL